MNRGSANRIVQALPGCSGTHLVIAAGASYDPERCDFALASLLGEHEARGRAVTAVTLRVGRREDVDWALPSMRWLDARGRRVILRTRVVLPRSLLFAARDAGATVLLELAHHRLELQRALLGEEAAAAAALLLQAQHLQQLSVPTGVHLGPVFAGVHDRERDGHGGLAVDSLFGHIAAADLHDLHISPGALTAARHARLSRALGPGPMHVLHRNFGIGPGEDAVALLRGAPRRPSHRARASLWESVATIAREHGLAVDRCGCAALCHLDETHRERARPEGAARAYVPVMQADLFATA